MRILGVNKLRTFTARPQTVFDTYYDFSKKKNVPNFRIPPIGRSIRITDLKGQPICIGRRHVRRGRFRLCYKKSTFEQQRVHAYELLDQCFSLLTQVCFWRILFLMLPFYNLSQNYNIKLLPLQSMPPITIQKTKKYLSKHRASLSECATKTTFKPAIFLGFRIFGWYLSVSLLCLII